MVSIMNSSFNLQKLLRDVFHPQVGEKGLVMVDLPTTQEQDNADWQERRVMAVEFRNEPSAETRRSLYRKLWPSPTW